MYRLDVKGCCNFVLEPMESAPRPYSVHRWFCDHSTYDSIQSMPGDHQHVSTTEGRSPSTGTELGRLYNYVRTSIIRSRVNIEFSILQRPILSHGRLDAICIFIQPADDESC